MKRLLGICAVAFFCFSCISTKPAPDQSKMVADMDPFSLASTNAFLDPLLAVGLKETDVEVIFHPRENEVALKFTLDFSEYWQTWNETARQSFIKAVNKYREDAANKKLINDHRKTRAIYGTVKGRVVWNSMNLISMSELYWASPSIDLGYRIIDNTQYFSTYQKTAREESKVNKDVTESWQFPMYFTLAECEELAKLFDQAYLRESAGK
jgi:hypothetical protein